MSQRPSFDPLRNLDQMVSLISDVTGESQARVIERLEEERKHPGKSVADDFARAGGPRYQWGKHLEDFYSATNAFLYELVVWNRNRLKRSMRHWTAKHMGRAGKPLDILSVGDGLGFDCLYLAGKSHRVTYFELPGISEQFAKNLFERSGKAIPMLTDPDAIPKESFDAITCFDVLEHVPDPPAMVRSLASYLRPGGHLYVSAPFFMILPWYPTHLRNNRKFAGSLSLYRQAGLRLADGYFTWYPLVLEKAGGEGKGMGSALHRMLIRMTAPIQMMGRVSALPFAPVHLLRRLGNKPY